MEKLERMYNKAAKALNISLFNEIKKFVNNLYEDYSVPEEQMFKVPTKWEFDKNTSLIGNIQILIDRNICEYVAKKNGYLKGGYTFKDGGFDANEEYTILLNSPAECTKDVKEDIEFDGEMYHIIFQVPEVITNDDLTDESKNV